MKLLGRLNGTDVIAARVGERAGWDFLACDRLVAEMRSRLWWKVGMGRDGAARVSYEVDWLQLQDSPEKALRAMGAEVSRVAGFLVPMAAGL